MTSKYDHMLECPKCGHKQSVQIWQSVNVTLEPELKKQLCNQEINVFDCSGCKEKAFINTELLYHDMTAKFCVQYYPPESLAEEDFYGRFSKQGTHVLPQLPPAVTEAGAYIAAPHIVFDFMEMLRYIRFRDKLSSGDPAK